MKTLFQPAQLREIQERLQQLQPDSSRQWGKMTPAQALAHCSTGLETATGQLRPPRLWLGRLIGRLVKPIAFREDEPMRRNVPTAQCLIVADDRDFAAERERLAAGLDRFAVAGAAGCTAHPHIFFGPLTPAEWGVLTYKHIDHHLRQFGA